MRFVLSTYALCFLLHCASWAPVNSAFGQESSPPGAVCRIYGDLPSPDDPDGAAKLAKSELVYQPHFVYPKARADENCVAINDRMDLNQLGPEFEGAGTICEFGFKLPSGTFAGIKWIPGGSDPGANPGLNIHQELRATRATPVFLTFRARTSERNRVKVTFKLGATAGQKHRDSLRFAESAKPTPTVVTDQWKEIAIPLRGKDLSSVICPLEVLVKAEDNPGVEVVDVYVDDVQFEVRQNQ